MSAVSASILVGNMHPNDQTIVPTHHVLLWEGDRSAWDLRTLVGRPRKTFWLPWRYDRVVPTLLALLAVGVLEIAADDPRLAERRVLLEAHQDAEIDRLANATLDFKGMAMAVTIHDPSSALRPDEVKGFGHRDLMVATPTWSRIWDLWSGSWQTFERDGST